MAVIPCRYLLDVVNLTGTFGDIPRDAHHSDYTTSNQDKLAGECMSHVAGDLYINHFNESPVEQWTKVAKALRVHGISISFASNVRAQEIAHE